MKEIRAIVTGMSCAHCVQTVSRAVKSIPGVLEVQIDSWESGRIEIRAESSVSVDELARKIADAGYRLTSVEVHQTGSAVSTKGRYDFDLIILGGGSAAFAAALRARDWGKTVLMINDGLPLGGTCVNVGCVPSKTLIRTAEALHRAAFPGFQSIQPAKVRFDFRKAIEEKRQLVAELQRKKYVDVIAGDEHIRVLQGRGKLRDRHTVEVDGERFTGRFLLIATGSRTFLPDIPGLASVPYFTHETLYELEELPEHLIVIGGRYIALETAQMFARFGSKVTLLQRSSRILPTEPPEITERLTAYLQQEGVEIRTGVRIREIRGDDRTVEVDVQQNGRKVPVEGSHLFLATGRRGNSEDIGLEEVGVKTFGRGFVWTDEYFRTSVENIFAAGDITGKHLFVYTAAYAGALSVENAFGDQLKPRDYSVVPWVIFTDPQVAGVGMDEEQAKKAGIPYDVSLLELQEVPRALAARDTRGVIMLVRDASSDRLLGARILAPEGGELVMPLAIALKKGMTIAELRDLFYPYLTLSEGIKLAAITFDKDVAKLSCCAV